MNNVKVTLTTMFNSAGALREAILSGPSFLQTGRTLKLTLESRRLEDEPLITVVLYFALMWSILWFQTMQVMLNIV